MRALLAGAGLLLLLGCASSPDGGRAGDPLEPINRPIYAFNDAFDRAVARPVARGYRAATPDLVQAGVGNFFSNLDDVPVLVNSILQLKGRKSATTAFRLLLNTTVGLYGLIDVASILRLPKQNEDFGQTLGHWGMGPGAYVVLPFLGPSSLRDTGGRIVDAQYDPLDEITDGDDEYYGAVLLNAIDTRARLLGATRVLDTAAIDPYAFTREAYLKRRANLVYDGDPPPAALPGDDEDATDGSPDAGSREGDDFDPFSDEDQDLFDGESGSSAE